MQTLLKMDSLGEEFAYGYLVSGYKVAELCALVCLVECLLVSVKLREYGAELHANLALKLDPD